MIIFLLEIIFKEHTILLYRHYCALYSNGRRCINMDAHAEKIHSIMNLILNKPSLFIATMLFDFFSALFSTISSVRLAIFTQNVIDVSVRLI